MQGSLVRLLVMSAFGGVSNAAILAAVNSGAGIAGTGRGNLWAAALFLVALFLFIKSQHYILITATVEIEAIIHKLRIRLLDLVRHAELIPLDAIGRARIGATITRETATLTQATNVCAFAAQSVVLIFFVAIYITYLSLLAFALIVVVVGFTALMLHAKSRDLVEGTREGTEWENRLFDRQTDL
jgi:putative ATP-binding cassette transporter